MRNKSYLLIIAILILALALSACGAGNTQNAADEAQPDEASKLHEATFIATEYAYQGPASIPSGWTELTLDNKGELAHDLILVKLAEGKTVDDVMAALSAEGPPEWAQFYGNVAAESGQTASYVVDLTPGNYVVLSFGQAEDAPPDAAQGMIANLTVTQAAAPVANIELPQADAEINLMDFAFGINNEIEAGEQSLRLNNIGTELHEVVMYRLKEGKTMEDFRDALDKAMSGEEMSESERPVEEVGATFMSPGVATYITQDFEAGEYVFICHIPSPSHEMKAHYELGMIQQVSVK